jgi:nucleotide-binding universal stress UspA family protein
MFKKIVVGFDGSQCARAALDQALALAKESGAELTTLWVREPLPHLSDLPGEYEEEVEAAESGGGRYGEIRKATEELAAQHGVTVRSEVRRGNPAKTILKYAEQTGCDLIVIGHADQSELWGRLLGDTADRIADHAHCSVLIVKRR